MRKRVQGRRLRDAAGAEVPKGVSHGRRRLLAVLPSSSFPFPSAD